MEKTNKKQSVRWLAILMPYVKPYYGTIILAVIFMIADSLLTSLRPWPLKIIIDKVLNGQNIKIPLLSEFINIGTLSNLTILYASCIAIILIAVGTGLFSYLFTLLIGNFSQRFIFTLKNTTFNHIQRLSLQFHTKKRMGDTMSRLTSDINSIQLLTSRSAILFLSNFFLIVSNLVIMFWLNWQYSLIACSVLPFLFFSIWWHTAKIKSISRTARISDGEVASIAQETLGSIRIVKGLAQEDRQFRLFDKQAQKSLSEYLKRNIIQARMAPIIDILAALGLSLVMYYGAKGVMSREMTIGDMIVFFFYVSNFYSPLRAMSRQFGNFSNGITGAERVAEILSNNVMVEQPDKGVKAPPFKGEVEFRNISFGYDPEQEVLKDVSFTIRSGEKVAIIGATGAGKSTLAGILLRFYEPLKGSVFIDGNDIKQYSLESLRQQIGLILQETYLFSGTIRENIIFGSTSNLSFEEIIEAAKSAHAHDFIMALPDGYNSHVFEGGANLSGGQRQRIAIARAIVRKVPILLLDEPTSNLDKVFEKSVLETLNNISYRPTLIMITHSLDAAKMSDTIIIFEDGRIVELGSPENLSADGTFFQKYVNTGLIVPDKI